MMKHKSYILTLLPLLLAILVTTPLAGQEKDRQHSDRLESARKLYYSGAYHAAETAFTELGKESSRTLDRSEIEAYKVMCAIALDKVNAEGLVNTFCNKYPNAPQQSMVKEALASRYFDTGKYTEALAVYNTINRNHLYRQQRIPFTFKKAYCNLRTGGYERAAQGFGEVLSMPYSQYTVPSTYYKGYVHYMQRQFAEAVPLFEKVGQGNQFSLMADYFAVESKLMLKRYDDVIAQGVPLFGRLDEEMKTSLARMLSEAYYEKGDQESAKRYLDIYTGSGTELSRKDHYFSGIISYSLKSYKAAIESFSHVTSEEDELCQNAWYYTGNSQLEAHNKLAALDAFKSAADLDFDPVIKEDAFFNYAKLAFDVNGDIGGFRDYLKVYPENGKDDIIHSYMATSFLLSKDYGAAVDALSSIREHSSESSANLQKAAFFRAMQLVEDNAWRSAEPLLETAIETGPNENLRNLANFWLAECLYRDERWSEAIAINLGLLADETFRRTSEYPQALYNQAYCYLKSGNYPAAETNFRNFLNVTGSSTEYEADAMTRLGDACFMQGDYSAAADSYGRVWSYDSSSSDLYPAIQAAIALGLMGEDARKIDLLKEITSAHRTAPLYPQAMYELGRTYVQKGNEMEATQCFNTLLGIREGNDYYLKSLLELALLNANAKRSENAIEYYKAVVSAAPDSPEAEDALAGLESLYQLLNQPEAYLAYLDLIGRSDTKSGDEREEMIFNSARQLHLSGQHSKAVTALNRYLSLYPSGLQATMANYYLAVSLKAVGRYEAAADTYAKVIKQGESSCLSDALREYAQLSYQLQRYKQSEDAWKRLLTRKVNDAVRAEAYTGLMRAAYKAKDYPEVISSARSVGTREANYLTAKSLRATGDREQAAQLFEELATDRSDAYGAESAYILIQDAYDRGDFAEVEEAAYAFSESGSGQAYWLARSFIVLGDSFADRGDLAQAAATYSSIEEGYQPYGADDDVPGLVRSRINLLKTK